MAYLLNSWYMIAWSDEVRENLFSRKILDISVVLFRKQDSQEIVALHDRCAHRFAPLSRGRIVGDGVECPYHGLVFEGGGGCVGNPFGAVNPAAARVRAFPVHEVDGTIWIWPGDAAAAEVAKVPRIWHHGRESPFRETLVTGLTTARADYRLLSDNLMDLSHTAMLHPGLGGRAYMPKVRAFEDEAGGVVAEFSIPNAPNFGGMDYLDSIRWMAPSVHVLDSQCFEPGTKDRVWFVPSAHILTPETPFTTHYFWSSGTPEGGSMDEIRAALVQAFDHEDKPMVEAVQREMGNAELFDLQPVLLASDVGAVRMRRKLAALIDAEVAATRG